MKTAMKFVAILMILGLALTALPGGFVKAESVSTSPLQKAGDRLVELQNTDGGWDWPLDDGNPDNVSPVNTIGPIGAGLAEAYLRTQDPDHLAALDKVGAFLLAKSHNFSPSDGYLAAKLDIVYTVTTYCDFVKANFYTPLASGTYYRADAPTVFYDTTGYVQRIRDGRSGSQANMAAWDVGMGLVAAASCGADTTAWIAGTKAEINELDSSNYYDVIGLAGALYGLAFVDAEFDPTAGSLESANSLADLAAILASYQINNGGFAWNSAFVIPNDGNETIQETAYAILALNEVNRSLYLSKIQGAADYMMSVQLANGGWENYPGSGENNEISAEGSWAVAEAYPYPEVWVCLSGDCGHPGFQFSSIQAGVNAVDPGGIVHVAAETFVENVSVNKPVSIIGAGSGTDGTIVTTPGSIDYKVGVFQIDASGTSASPLLLQNIRIQPVGQAGISIGRFTEATGKIVSYLSLDNVFVIGTNNHAETEQERGLYVDLTSTLDHLSITDSAFNNLAYGWYFQKQVSADTSTVSNVQVINTSFNHNNLKGLYTEKLTNATFTDCMWNQNGYDATGLPSYFIPWMSGIDLNLKAGVYQDIIFENPVITNNALGGAQHGVGIAIKARNDGSYAGFPATLTNVQITGATITGNERGVRVGEPNKVNDAITGVVIEDSSIFGNLKTYTGTDGSTYGDLVNLSPNSVDASPNWWGVACGPQAISGNIVYAPWWADEAMTTTLSSNLADYTFAAGTSTEDMNATIACAAPGSTFTFQSGNHNGDIVIPAGQEHLTFTLKNGAIINANSPCFTVNASYTTITTESIGGAKCIPTGGSNGIDVASGLVNIILKGMEIDGTSKETGAGISFAGAIEDVQVVDNYIHDLDGDGLLFNAQPAGVIDIQGNMFKGNTGLGVNNLNGTAPINATYNSWGSQGGPEGAGGDGVSDNVTFSPWTNVDLYLNSADSPWEFQVVKGSNITITVKGDLSNVTGASFKLEYDTSLLDLVSATPTSLFLGVPPIGTLLDTATDGVVKYDGYNATAVSGTGQLFYTLVFTGTASGTAYVRFDETTDVFGMSPTAGPSNNIYANTLADGSVKVIDLPTMTIVPLETCYAGLPCQFQLHITNPENGEDPTAPWYLNFTVPTGTILEFNNEGSWEVISSGWELGGVDPEVSITPTFRATFYTPGPNPMSVFLMDPAPDPDFQLATDDETFAVAGNFSLLGTFSMQGRVFRGGIPVTLTWAGTPAYAPLGTTVDIISKNLSMSLTYGGVYTITTNQPRYLNVTADLGKTANITAARTLTSLELKGGNAKWDDNIIDILDAGQIGGEYGSPTPGNGDVNFDGKVNIQDLALVGSNWHVTSASAYGTWVP